MSVREAEPPDSPGGGGSADLVSIDALLRAALTEPNPAAMGANLAQIQTLFDGLLSSARFDAAAKFVQRVQAAEREAEELQAIHIAKLLQRVLAAEPRVAQILSFLTDGKGSAAVVGLLRVLGPAAVGGLLAAFAGVGSPQLKHRVAELIAELGGPSSGEAFLERLRALPPVAAAELLPAGAPLAQAELAPVILWAAEHDHPKLRAGALRMLGPFASGVADELLCHALTDLDLEVRLAALELLRSRKHPTFRAALEKVLKDEDHLWGRDPRELSGLAHAYAHAAGAGAVPLLAKLMNPGMLSLPKAGAAQVAIAEVLGRLGTPEAREALEHASRTISPKVREACKKALARAPAAAEELELGFDDGEATVAEDDHMSESDMLDALKQSGGEDPLLKARQGWSTPHGGEPTAKAKRGPIEIRKVHGQPDVVNERVEKVVVPVRPATVPPPAPAEAAAPVPAPRGAPPRFVPSTPAPPGGPPPRFVPSVPAAPSIPPLDDLELDDMPLDAPTRVGAPALSLDDDGPSLAAPKPPAPVAPAAPRPAPQAFTLGDDDDGPSFAAPRAAPAPAPSAPKPAPQAFSLGDDEDGPAFGGAPPPKPAAAAKIAPALTGLRALPGADDLDDEGPGLAPRPVVAPSPRATPSPPVEHGLEALPSSAQPVPPELDIDGGWTPAPAPQAPKPAAAPPPPAPAPAAPRPQPAAMSLALSEPAPAAPRPPPAAVSLALSEPAPSRVLSEAPPTARASIPGAPPALELDLEEEPPTARAALREEPPTARAEAPLSYPPIDLLVPPSMRGGAPKPAALSLPPLEDAPSDEVPLELDDEPLGGAPATVVASLPSAPAAIDLGDEPLDIEAAAPPPAAPRMLSEPIALEVEDDEPLAMDAPAPVAPPSVWASVPPPPAPASPPAPQLGAWADIAPPGTESSAPSVWQGSAWLAVPPPSAPEPRVATAPAARPALPSEPISIDVSEPSSPGNRPLPALPPSLRSSSPSASGSNLPPLPSGARARASTPPMPAPPPAALRGVGRSVVPAAPSGVGPVPSSRGFKSIPVSGRLITPVTPSPPPPPAPAQGGFDPASMLSGFEGLEPEALELSDEVDEHPSWDDDAKE